MTISEFELEQFVSTHLGGAAGLQDRFKKLPVILEDWLAPVGGLDNRRILDFGCGVGITALSLAIRHPSSTIIGVDISTEIGLCGPLAAHSLGLPQLPASFELRQTAPFQFPEEWTPFDLIYSWSVFEHISQPLFSKATEWLYELLRPGGCLFVQVAPLFYSPEGSHLCHRVPLNWGHLYIQSDIYEEQLRCACHTEEEFKSLWSTFQTLNRITAAELKDSVARAGFGIVREYVTVHDAIPPIHLTSIFSEEVLRTEQIVLLAQRPDDS